MDDYLSEKEQIELIRKWWKENGLFVVGGLVLGAALIGGWKYWQSVGSQQTAQASVTYESLLAAVEGQQRDEALGLAAQLTTDYASTPYAAHAGLAMAKLYLEAGETDVAVAQLRAVVDQASEDEVRHIARLRLARVLLYQENANGALELLDPVPAGAGAFTAMYYELRGDLHTARGDTAAARSNYEQAISLARQGTVDAAVIEMKINDLDGSADESAPAADDADES